MAEETYKARYMRYHNQDEYEADTLDEAIGFLAGGWEAGSLSEIAIVGPDGSVVLEGAALFDRMMERVG